MWLKQDEIIEAVGDQPIDGHFSFLFPLLPFHFFVSISQELQYNFVDTLLKLLPLQWAR